MDSLKSEAFNDKWDKNETEMFEVLLVFMSISAVPVVKSDFILFSERKQKSRILFFMKL